MIIPGPSGGRSPEPIHTGLRRMVSGLAAAESAGRGMFNLPPDAAVPIPRADALWVVLQCKALRDRFDEVGLDAARDRWVPGLRHFARQFRDALDGLHRLCLRDDPFLDEQMEEALTQHQGDTALRIGHW